MRVQCQYFFQTKIWQKTVRRFKQQRKSKKANEGKTISEKKNKKKKKWHYELLHVFWVISN